MPKTAPDDVAAELALTVEKAVVLTAFQYRMMQRDVAAEKSAKQRARKRFRRDQFRTEAVTLLTGFGEELDDDAAEGTPTEFTGEGWVERFGAALRSKSGAARYAMLEEAPALVAANVRERSRALLLLIDLYGFEPWNGGDWVDRTRADTLREAVRLLTPLRGEDLDSVAHEYRAVLRQLRRKNISWGKVLAVGAAGLGLGVVTAGLAAPLIGGVVGSVLGYGGAAATSAGLAALGGGSLAAGGLGMAGGTALIAGIGGVAGAGAAAGGVRLTGWTAGQVVSEAIKLEVVTRLVLLDAQGDDEKARKVIEGLHLRISQVQERLGELAEQVIALREELATAKAESMKKDEALQDARAQVQRLEEELVKVQTERKQVEFSQTALEVVVERLDKAA